MTRHVATSNKPKYSYTKSKKALLKDLGEVLKQPQLNLSTLTLRLARLLCLVAIHITILLLLLHYYVTLAFDMNISAF